MFSIFRDFFGGRLAGVFEALQEALSFIGRNQTLDLGPDDGVRDQVTLDDRRANGADGASSDSQQVSYSAYRSDRGWENSLGSTTL